MICKPCAQTADFSARVFVEWPDVEIPPKLGHVLCKGCDCQHKPVKAGQIEKGNS